MQLPASVLRHIDNPVRFFRAMDEFAAANPLSNIEADRLAELTQRARTVGVGGKERMEYALLQRRARG